MSYLRWTPPPAFPQWEPGVIHLWELSFCALANPKDLPDVLSANEKARADRLRISIKQNQFIQGRTFTRLLLGRYLNLPPEEIDLLTGPQGKPYVAQARGLGFNLSHSGDLGLLAIGPPSVGVDVEQLQPRDFTALSQRFFSPEEGILISNSANPQSDFYRTWTAKEAILKAHGAGLTIPLNRFSVPRTEKDHVDLEGEKWGLWQFQPREGFCGAVSWNNTSPIRQFSTYSFTCELMT